MNKTQKKKILEISALALFALLGVYLIWQGSRKAPAPNNVPQPQLQQETEQSGYGDQAVQAGDFITVKYIGARTDDTMFYSNLSDTDPYRTYIGQGTAFPGWDQGLIGMKVGERRKLTVPAGTPGVPDPQAPAGATLIYQVELLDIQR